jgi:hypothetical protein
VILPCIIHRNACRCRRLGGRLGASIRLRPASLLRESPAVIDEPAAKERLAIKARQQSLRYDWNTSARLTWDAIQDFHARGGAR